MKRRKRKERPGIGHARKKHKATASLLGHDFGCRPIAMALGSFGFTGHLHNAHVVGVSYGFARSEELNRVIPEVALVARDESRLRQAFDEFNAWADQSDGDALEVTFVFRSSGGYVIALAPEKTRLTQRCLGFDRTHAPILTFAAWCKPIDSVHPILQKIRKYAKGLLAPVQFTGAVLSNLVAVGSSNDPPVREMVGVKPLLKFESAFVDEQDIEPNTTAWLAMNMLADDAEDPKPVRDHRERSPEAIKDARVLMLRTHFPVTLERLRLSDRYRKLLASLTQQGVRAWQIEQAYCNYVVQRTTAGGTGESSTTKGKVDMSAMLRERYEVADGASLNEPTDLEIVLQVTADSAALLRYAGRKGRVADLAAGQASLARAGFIDAESAIGTSFPVPAQHEEPDDVRG